MPRTRNPYPTEFRNQIIPLARAGCRVESLAREIEPCAATIHGWVKQFEIDKGDRNDGLTSDEREELLRLRREVRQLRQERDFGPVALSALVLQFLATSAPMSQNRLRPNNLTELLRWGWPALLGKYHPIERIF